MAIDPPGTWRVCGFHKEAMQTDTVQALIGALCGSAGSAGEACRADWPRQMQQGLLGCTKHMAVIMRLLSSESDDPIRSRECLDICRRAAA